MAMTIFTAWWRNRKALDTSWPIIYWFLVFLFTLGREEDTYNLNIILVGLVAGLMLRFEFMNPFFARLVKTIEFAVWCYVLYRGYQIIFY